MGWSDYNGCMIDLKIRLSSLIFYVKIETFASRFYVPVQHSYNACLCWPVSCFLLSCQLSGQTKRTPPVTKRGGIYGSIQAGGRRAPCFPPSPQPSRKPPSKECHRSLCVNRQPNSVRRTAGLLTYLHLIHEYINIQYINDIYVSITVMYVFMLSNKQLNITT